MIDALLPDSTGELLEAGDGDGEVEAFSERARGDADDAPGAVEDRPARVTVVERAVIWSSA